MIEGSERGSAAVEFAGTLPLILLAALAVWQLLLVTAVITSTENAARTGSRVLARGGDGGQAAQAALPAWLRNEADTQTAEGTRVTVAVRVPIVLPAWRSSELVVRRDAELPSPGGAGGSPPGPASA